MALLDDANAKDKKRAADLNEKRAWHSAARKAPPLIPNDRRSADLTKPDGLATPAQDLEKSESLSTVPKGLSEPATIDEPRTEAKTPAAPLWTDGHQAEADRRAAGVAAAGLVNAINSKNTGWFFKHLNELSNPAFEPNIGDALKAAVGKNSLSNLSHYKSMMNALEEGRDAWSGFSKDKKDRIDAMLTLWKNILVEERGNAPPPAAVSRTYYQGTIHLLAGTDLPKPPVR